MANESLFNEHWYRVADLKPQLRDHAAVFHHRYRGRDWWVVRDRIASRHHRLSETAYRIVKRMDGQRTVEQIWDEAVQTLGDDVPTQSEIIGLLGKLHQADLMQTDVTPDADELFRRHENRKTSKTRQSYFNPLFMRFSLFDPDRVLSKIAPKLNWLLSLPMLILSGLTIVYAAVQAASHASELGHYAEETLLLPTNIALMLFIFPVMKALHELGHGLVLKKRGAEVHDMGIMLLLLLPIPYVDASAAAVFREKSQRIGVSAAGIIVELVLASLGLFVWLLVEPGIIQRAAFDVMVIGGVSSLIFNGNPLMRFDGYYILMDWIEIPNLAQRSKAYLGELARRIMLGAQSGQLEASTGEKAWFVGYGIAAFIYRLVVLLAIAFYLGTEFFVVGVLLAAWTVSSQLLFPFFKAVFRLIQQSKMPGPRARIVACSLLFAMVIYGSIFAVPVPMTTAAEGVVWLQDQSVVRTDNDCFVAEVFVTTGTKVEQGTPLFRCTDINLTTRQELLDNQFKGLNLEYESYRLREAVKRNMIAEDLRALDAERDLNRSRIEGLLVRSRVDGVYVVQGEEHLPGRFFAQGQTIGFVVNAPVMAIRTVVTQDRVDLVRMNTESVQVRFADSLSDVHITSIALELPASTDRLPTAALGSLGGGEISVNPIDEAGTMALEEVYLFDVSIPGGLTPNRIGGRAYVQFDHGSETLSDKMAREMRLLFLRQFDV